MDFYDFTLYQFIIVFSLCGSIIGATIGLQSGISFLQLKAPEFCQEFREYQRLSRISKQNQNKSDLVLVTRRLDGSMSTETVTIPDNDILKDIDYLQSKSLICFYLFFIFESTLRYLQTTSQTKTSRKFDT